MKVGKFVGYMYTRFSKNDSGPRSTDHADSCLKRFRKHLSVPKSLSSLHYFGFSGRTWTFYSHRSHLLLCSEDAFIYWISSQVVEWRLIALQNKTIRLCVYVLWTAASQFDTGHQTVYSGFSYFTRCPILKSGAHIFSPFPIHPTVLRSNSLTSSNGPNKLCCYKGVSV